MNLSFYTTFRKLLLPLLLLSVLKGKAQEVVDSVAEKAEPAAVNTNSINIFDSAAAIRYKKVDDAIFAMKRRNKKIPVLAKEITAPFSTEEEKVRALFDWITNNIAYDCAAYHSKTEVAFNFNYKSQEELLQKIDKYYTTVASLTLRNKKAVCEGYAVLFREFCKENGIECQLVEGRASDNKDKIKKLRKRSSFSTNHTWNKVRVNGTWYYIDVTWASGYCDKKVTRFYKKFNPYYFLVPLDELYATHAENIKFTERRNNPTGTRD
ncbi:MAG: transglutaminase domain-containing protein [Bacteroidia bacterium]|jgi:transglutaminase/protease-like cytokinesis protein 3